jgi:hypothetical protein
MSTAPASAAASALREALTSQGYSFVDGQTMRGLLDAVGPLDDWTAFSDSWNDLSLDEYMADGGRYRRRRHAVFHASEAGLVRQPHQPHYQSLEYNPLHGGLARLFEPVHEAVADGATLQTILTFCHRLFDVLSGPQSWRVEIHQFRIEARRDQAGLPTPEGLHRDGVDWVLVLLVNRRNIARGTTAVHALDGRLLGRFTLTDPCDAALVDDRRVAHGVTAVEAIDPAKPAYRDVLVVTFRKAEVRS